MQRPGEISSDPVQHVLSRLRVAGFKLTPQRIAIVEELSGDTTHPTAQELFARLKPRLPSMSFATVYNTLSTLAEAGVCSSVALTKGPTRFDPNTTPHDHAVCDACGCVVDVALRSDSALAERREAEGTLSNGPPVAAGSTVPTTGFQVRLVERIYRGLCAECTAANQTVIGE